MKKTCIIIFYCISFFLASCSFQNGKSKSNKNSSELLFMIDESGNRKAINTGNEWYQNRQQIIENMQLGMGIIPSLKGLPDFNLQYSDSLRGTNYMRYTIQFWVADNELLAAYLYIPDDLKPGLKYPAMLALHETDSIGKGSVDGQGRNKNLAYGKELAQKGYIVIAPDYPGFGDLKGYDYDKDRYQSGSMKGIFDHIRCIDLLQTLTFVDPDKIGVIGHSLGGHNAIFVGAIDTRLKVVITSCGWTGFNYYDVGAEASKKYGGRLGPWATPKYMPLLRERFKLDAKKIPFDFDRMIAAIAPRVFISNSPINDKNFNLEGVKSGIKNAADVFRFLKVPENIQVFYPEAAHDFPEDIRQRTYQILDSIFHK